jgi:hypothetical protein
VVSFTVNVVVQDGPPAIDTVIVVWPTPTSVPAVGDWEMPVQSPGLTLASTFGTAAWQFPSAAADVGGGHVIAEHGGTCTSMLNVHWDVLFEPSVAVQVTCVVPALNVEPEAGTHTTFALPHASVASGVL